MSEMSKLKGAGTLTQVSQQNKSSRCDGALWDPKITNCLTFERRWQRSHGSKGKRDGGKKPNQKLNANFWSQWNKGLKNKRGVKTGVSLIINEQS